MKHSLLTRMLHMLVAAAIVLQLADAQLMRVPRPGRQLTGIEAAAFTLHEYVGLASLAIIVLFWLRNWCAGRRPASGCSSRGFRGSALAACAMT
jgi:cytochrome b561